MNRHGSIGIAVLILAVVGPAAGCKKKSDRVTLNGSGATFQKAAQEIAIDAFSKVDQRVIVNYAGGGSGKGRKEFADQVVDFACTDAPYKAEEAATVKGGDFVYIPNVLGAITVSYRLDGVDRLQLSPETIAKIFQREIRKWDDPAIAQDNPDAKLPGADIIVARRADGSGTTENFTKFLTLAAPMVWKLKSGSTVQWPDDARGGNGNNGVAQIVKDTSGAIGYVDLSDAVENKLRYAAVKNQAGKYVMPDAASVTAAGEGIQVDDKLLFSALNAGGAAAYPITAQSWCMAYAKQPDQAKGAALKAYLKFLLTDGQALLPQINFAPVPKALQAKALAQIEKIQVP